MAKKKQPPPPPKPPQFRTTPFSSLKGVVTASAPDSPKPPEKTSTPLLPNEDSATLFLQAMDGVIKMGGPSGKGAVPATFPPHMRNAATKGSSDPQKTVADELFLQEIGRLKLEVKFTETLPDEDELKPLSGNRLRQLKRGVITVDYQLDLHGLTRDEALAELPRFLRSARMKGQTAVLVITGKGNNSSGEPVLLQAVTAWLRDAGREMVVEFSPAPREMGGSGAFVVFLRPTVPPSVKPSKNP